MSSTHPGDVAVESAGKWRMTSGSHHYPTHHIPDDGTRYAPGETVRIDHSSGRVEIIKDPDGTYEGMSCRPATEYTAGPPLLRVDLRRRGRNAPPDETPDPWAPRRP
jgi:hypothetical protein